MVLARAIVMFYINKFFYQRMEERALVHQTMDTLVAIGYDIVLWAYYGIERDRWHCKAVMAGWPVYIESAAMIVLLATVSVSP